MLLFSGCVTTGPVVSTRGAISAGELSDFVQGAAEYAGHAGESAAIEELSKKPGSFCKGDLCIYAYGFNGTLLALPQDAYEIGTDRSNWTDARGFPAIRVAAYAAMTGGGYFTYLCPEPAVGITDETVRDSYIPKVGYAHAVDGDWWVGSDIYIQELAGDGNGSFPAAVGEMIALVEEGAAYGRSHGEDDSFREISNRSGIFLDTKGHYLYAYDYNGTLLAHPYLTGSIGDCLIEREDPFGMMMIRALSETAESGGGFVVFIWPNPDKDNRLEQKIGYVMPVDEKWWVGSGVYLSEITGIDTSLPALPQ